MSSPEPATVAELLDQIAASREDFELALQEANEQPPPEGEWGALDHMAHIAAWEHSLLQLLRGEPRRAGLDFDAATYNSLGEDGINDLIYRKFHDTPAKEVRRYAEQMHRDLLETLEGFEDEDLQRPYSHYQPNDPPHNPAPVIGWIMGNTVAHYAEHARILRAIEEAP